MFFCRCCNADFDVIKRKPMILLCGHTYCNGCLSESFASTGKFDCTNCPFSTSDFASLIPNLILTDLNSLRQHSFSSQSTLIKPPFSPQIPDSSSRFFRSPYAAFSDVPYAQQQFQQMKSAKNMMDIEGENDDSVANAFKGISLKAENFGQSTKIVACNSQLCRARAVDGKCSGRCRNGSITKRNTSHTSLRHSSPKQSSQNVHTPAKPKPFATPGDPRFQSNFFQHSTIQKPVFNSPGFGRSAGKRCARAGCINQKHPGFGDHFRYCSINCHKMIEGTEWTGR